MASLLPPGSSSSGGSSSGSYEDVAAAAASSDGSDSDGSDGSDSDGDGAIDFSALAGELSAETLAALKSHVAATDAATAEETAQADDVATATLPAENYGMSQFWWDDASADALALEAISVSLPTDEADGGSAWGTPQRAPRRVGVLSAPSVWLALKRLLLREKPPPPPPTTTTTPGEQLEQGAAGGERRLHAAGIAASARDDRHFLLEFDERFAQAAEGAFEFAFYDYSDLSTVPPALHGTCDYLLAGPPYVSTACIDLYVQAFDLLARHPDTPRAIVIGATLEEPLADRGFAIAEDVELSYQSKFCTPMRLYRKYREGTKLPSR